MAREMTGKVLRNGACVTAVALVFVGAGHAIARHTARINQKLTATAAAPSAHGSARLSLKSSKNGRLQVSASHLKAGKSYQVIVGGVKVGTLQTSQSGRGKTRFSTTPDARNSLLGFDPRGDQMLVRDEEDGEDVLVGDIPDDDPNSVACCLPDSDGEGETECEDMTQGDCGLAGGTVPTDQGVPVASCLPDPCATTPPSGGMIVCCTNATGDDESEAECTSVQAQADCAALGGAAVDATSCEPNPCQVTPPANPVVCCIPQSSDDGETEPAECEVVSGDACTAAGGMPNAATTCDPDPCN